MGIETTRVPDKFDLVLRNIKGMAKIVNNTGHDLKAVRADEDTWFLYLDDSTS